MQTLRILSQLIREIHKNTNQARAWRCQKYKLWLKSENDLKLKHVV